MTPTAPVDATHADSLAAVEQIRHRLTAVRLQVARWEPRRVVEVITEGFSTPCHVWTGYCDPDGYGRTRIAGQKMLVHRGVMARLHGLDAIEGRVVMHLCDNPPCCNPDHLRIGTPRDNSLDCIQKGRHATGERAGSSKLTAGAVREILRLHSTGDWTHRALGKEFGVSHNQIGKIVRAEAWAHEPRTSPQRRGKRRSEVEMHSTTIRLPLELFERLDAHCKRTGSAWAQVARDACNGEIPARLTPPDQPWTRPVSLVIPVGRYETIRRAGEACGLRVSFAIVALIDIHLALEPPTPPDWAPERNR